MISKPALELEKIAKSLSMNISDLTIIDKMNHFKNQINLCYNCIRWLDMEINEESRKYFTEEEIIKAQIESYVPFNEQEEIDKQTILSFIDSFDDVLTRQNSYGHLTASAFVVNEDLTKALILHHNIFGGFIYPGGHADGEYDLYSVAVREVSEETGLDVVPLIDNSIFALQALPVKGHVKKEKYVSAHIHYDILYLLVAKNIDMDKIRILESENSQVKWYDLEDTYNEEAVDWIRSINEKIVQKVRS